MSKLRTVSVFYSIQSSLFHYKKVKLHFYLYKTHVRLGLCHCESYITEPDQKHFLYFDIVG